MLVYVNSSAGEDLAHNMLMFGYLAFGFLNLSFVVLMPVRNWLL